MSQPHERKLSASMQGGISRRGFVAALGKVGALAVAAPAVLLGIKGDASATELPIPQSPDAKLSCIPGTLKTPLPNFQFSGIGACNSYYSIAFCNSNHAKCYTFCVDQGTPYYDARAVVRQIAGSTYGCCIYC